jgi:cytochrome c553
VPRACWRIAFQASLAVGLIVVADLHAQTAGSVTLPDSIQTRVMACATCHGPRGEGSRDDYFPRLAGKPAGYLYNQLVAFRNERRKYAPMNYLLEYLPDSYLQEMAQYFAAQQTPFPVLPKPKVGADVLALGEKLALEGDKGRRIPACTACHGISLTGLSPDIPGLLGLHAKYVSAQLGASRYGARVTDHPNCMARITTLLTDADITAVSAWLSSRPAPLNPAAAAEGSLPLALNCAPGAAR